MNTPTTVTPLPDLFGEASSHPDSCAIETGSAMTQEPYTLVAQQPFFKGLDPRQLQLFAESALQMHFEEGHSILEEGQPSQSVFSHSGILR